MKLGIDAEFLFVRSDGSVVPSCMVVNYKDDPHYLWTSAHGFYEARTDYWEFNMYSDGVQAESNTHPHHCRESLAHMMKVTRHHVERIVKTDCILMGPSGITSDPPRKLSRDKMKAMKVSDVSFVSGAPVDLDLKHEAGERACVSGCDPDINAYTGEFVYGVPNYEDHPFVWCGMHIHMGVAYPIKDANSVIKMLDRTSGLMSVAMSEEDDVSRMRRRFYGGAGAYRIKDYGLEYRVIGSDAWCSYTSVHMLSGPAKTLGVLVESGRERRIVEKLEILQAIISDADIQDIINLVQKREAIEAIKAQREVLEDLHHDQYHSCPFSVENNTSMDLFIEDPSSVRKSDSAFSRL